MRTCVSEDVEKLEFLYTFNWNVKGAVPMEDSIEVPQKVTYL
jgi:hypothetical protein